MNEYINSEIIIDNALGFEPEIEVADKWQVIDRFAEAGFTGLSLSIATDSTHLSDTIHYMSQTTQTIQSHPDKYLLARNVDDFEQAKRESKLALSYMFQGANPIEKDLSVLDSLKQLGLRSMIVTYNARNAFGDGCIEVNDAGLSRLGIELIKKMNEKGILIDCSHSGEKTSLDIMSQSKHPVIFSHSNVAAIHPHPRNLSDKQIIACAESGGFIGINGNGPLLGDNQASLESYIKHIRYIIDLVGDDHVALGTDLVYFQEIFDAFMAKNPHLYPKNYGIEKTSKWQSVQPEALPMLITQLNDYGFSNETITKLLGGNYMRVIREVWK